MASPRPMPPATNTGTAVAAPKGSSYGNARTYKQTKENITVNLRVSAWTWDGKNVTDAYLGNNTASNGGLFDINRTEGKGGGNTHTIDNQAGFDFLLFQFDRNVQLTGVTANAFAIGSKGVDNDLTIGRSVSLGGSWDAAPTGLNNMAVGNMAKLFQAQRDIDSSYTKGTLDVNRVLNPAGTSAITGKVWMISASLSRPDTTIDSFKLDTLKIQTNSTMGVLGPVPEPATWLTMIVGFGAIGGVARRRRSATAITA